MENFDEWLVIPQSFPYKPLSLNVSPRKPTINSSKFTFVNDSVQVIPHQIFALYGTGYMALYLSVTFMDYEMLVSYNVAM